MLVSTLTSLCGSFMLSPIINRIQEFVTGTAPKLTGPGKIANDAIESLTGLPFLRDILPANEFFEVALYILAAVCLLGCIYLVGIASSYFQARLMLTVSQNATEAIRRDLFEHLQTLPVRFFDSNTTGEVMSRFTNDVDNIDVMMNNSLTSLVSGAVSLIGTFVFMVTTNLWLTLITVVFIPIFAKAARISPPAPGNIIPVSGGAGRRQRLHRGDRIRAEGGQGL